MCVVAYIGEAFYVFDPSHGMIFSLAFDAPIMPDSEKVGN